MAKPKTKLKTFRFAHRDCERLRKLSQKQETSEAEVVRKLLKGAAEREGVEL